jgi:GNAT superfamily N-acetyltransferase
MSLRVEMVLPPEVMALRREHRQEVNAQIVHDQISEREGWTRTYRLVRDGVAVGFGSVAIAGPWKDRPTLYEFFLRTEERTRAFAWFEELLQVSQATRLEVQTNEYLLTTLALTYGRNWETEAVVFRHGEDTQLPSHGARLSQVTPGEEVQKAIERRRGGGEWALKLEDQVIGKGGVLCHYNPPYGDLHMEIAEPFRRRGWGSYLLQEMIRECRRLAVTPVARCNVNNVASRRTLQRAGFVPCALIVTGALELRPQ